MRGIDHKALGRFLLESGYIAPSISPLCRRMFLFGCIEPDINPLTYTRGSLRHRFLHGHNAANAKRHLRRIIRRMCRKGVHSPIQWFVFGAALHYITDSFTFVHNDIFEGTLGEHRTYEHALHPLFLHYLETPEAHNDTPSPDWDFEKTHEAYLADERSFATDCRYTVDAAIALCHAARVGIPELDIEKAAVCDV